MLGFRRYWDALFAYPRFLGVIKPDIPGYSASQLRQRLAALSNLWPKRLEPPVGKRILALSPHPDDESIGAGGLLIAHKDLSEIGVATVYKGDKGGRLPAASDGSETDPDRLTAARANEIERACSHFNGVFLGSLGYSDEAEPRLVFEGAGILRDMVRRFDPDVVIMPSLFDEHPGHRVTNLLWATACADVRCMVLGSEIWTLIEPNAYFDITSFLSRKAALVREFGTQCETVDYVGMTEALARVRGFHAGWGREKFGAAEAFFALPNKDYCRLAAVLCAVEPAKARRT